MLTDNLTINENGHLLIGGVDTITLAKECGTPAYVMDEGVIRENCRKFKKSIDEYYDGKGLVCYANKVFCCKAMCNIMREEGMGLDVVSSGELYTAISTGFPTDKICFHGNNKTKDEITFALSHGVGRIIVDNFEELERLDKIAGKLHKKANIMFRVKPGIDAHTHSFVQTGQIDSKFGVALETGEAFEIIKKAITMENVVLKGVHCHIGSQIFDISPFELAAKVMLGLIAKVRDELGYTIEELNLGGGFGIKYLEEDNPPEYDEYMKRVAATVNKTCEEYSLDRPFIYIEPGRSIAGPAGITLYTVGSVKEIPNVRTYVAVDGGMADNPRYALYQSEYTAVVTGWTISQMAVFGSTLSEAEILGYAFPSDIDTIAVNDNTTVSALNNLIAASSGSKIILSVADGVEIAVDTAFVASVPVEVASSGSITLSANAQPDASYFSAVSFAVEGALLRSWLTPSVVGFNFNANGGRNGQGNADGAADTALALEIGTWYKDAYSPSGRSTAMFSDGLSLLTWKANNVYAEADSLTAGTFIQGYLDDGNNVDITLSNVPYATYDVIIYCSTDNSTKSFKAKTVNGTIYTWDATAGAAVTTDNANATWGLASAAAGKAVYGANTLRINGLSGPLSIIGGTNSDNARGCISAIQIMPAGTSTAPEMTVGTAGQTTQATWTGANWNVATAPTSGNVVINVSGDVELTIDEAVALSAITVTGEGKLKIIPDQPNNVAFTASSISSAVPLLFANDGIGIDTISAPVTYLYKTPSINSSTYGNTYMAGVGSQESSVAINHNGGSVVLDGTAGNTYYLQESASATSTTVMFTNVTATYSTCFGVGAASYVIAGQSTITTGVNSDNPQSFVLSQGGSNRTSTFLLKDASTVTVTGTSDVDSNQASVMFGHWNGPSTFYIQDSAAFNATCQVLVGKTSNDHTININGGTFTAKGIKASASASGTNRLNLNGGLLVLGDVGITSYGSTTIGVNVSTNSEIRASAATLPISQAMTLGGLE